MDRCCLKAIELGTHEDYVSYYARFIVRISDDRYKESEKYHLQSLNIKRTVTTVERYVSFLMNCQDFVKAKQILLDELLKMPVKGVLFCF